jgi:FkbM family methyltransferase
VFHTAREMPEHNHIQTTESIFGTYKFIGDNYGYSILSPAFERPDKELFINLLQQSLRHNKRVLYLDVGAYVGDYTVGVLKFLDTRYLTTYVFEPDPVNYLLLRENLRINRIKGIRPYPVGLGDANKTIKVPGYSKKRDVVYTKPVSYTFRKLDWIIPASFYKKFDVVFVKIDIEGHEEEAFDGAKNLLHSGKKVTLMIEDCVNPSIIRYLKNHGFRFMTKITPYDSFWELN